MAATEDSLGMHFPCVPGGVCAQVQCVLKGRHINSLCEWKQVNNQRVQQAASIVIPVFY